MRESYKAVSLSYFLLLLGLIIYEMFYYDNLIPYSEIYSNVDEIFYLQAKQIFQSIYIFIIISYGISLFICYTIRGLDERESIEDDLENEIEVEE